MDDSNSKYFMVSYKALLISHQLEINRDERREHLAKFSNSVAELLWLSSPILDGLRKSS